MRPNFREKIEKVVTYHNFLLTEYYKQDPVSVDDVITECLQYTERLQPMLVDVPLHLAGVNKAGDRILFEGAQGALLDIDHGTYPFVTSSNTVVGGVASSAGVSMQSVRDIFGIAKMYTTRVGSGPFPTELFDDNGKLLAERGFEFGATTGRPRRCGWLDLPALRRVAIINGLTGLIMTKLDVLDTMESIQLCVAYRRNGVEHAVLPDDFCETDEIEPVYETMPGWQSKTMGITQYDDLPENAKKYIERVHQLTEVEIKAVSTGPDRAHMIWC